MPWFKPNWVVLGAISFTATHALGAGPAPSSEAGKLRARRSSREVVSANACASCHRSLPETRLRLPAEQYLTSVHRDARIGCVGCHGGDPEDPTVRAHTLAGFVPRPSQSAVIEICGGCHGDARFVRELNPRLGVDQATLYDLSRHSKLARSGDPNAPSCATCHGVHDIVRVGAATAPVNRRNVDRLCGKCHADAVRMKPYEIDTDQVEKWKRGAHSKAFLGGNASAPTCTGCHGPHAGAAAAGATSRVCGNCHADQLKLVNQSPHAKPFAQLGLSECVPCHDKHDVIATSWLVGITPDSACGRCHARDQKVRVTAQEIATLLRDVREKADAARAALDGARSAGLLVSGGGPALDELRTEELKLESLVHSVDPNQLKPVARAATEAAGRATKLAEGVRVERRIQRRGYYTALGLSLLLLVLFLFKAVELDRRRRRGEA